MICIACGRILSPGERHRHCIARKRTGGGLGNSQYREHYDEEMKKSRELTAQRQREELEVRRRYEERQQRLRAAEYQMRVEQNALEEPLRRELVLAGADLQIVIIDAASRRQNIEREIAVRTRQVGWPSFNRENRRVISELETEAASLRNLEAQTLAEIRRLEAPHEARLQSVRQALEVRLKAHLAGLE